MEESSVPSKVTMTCMTKKQKFDVEGPEVVVLKNGRYAFRAECPWEGKNGKRLVAFKFCSARDYEEYTNRQNVGSESEHILSESKHAEEEPEV